MLPEIKILGEEILSDFRYSYSKVAYEYSIGDKPAELVERGVFHRGNGAAILLFNPESKTIILTRQFRLPTYLNGNPTGMLLEACAGTMENESPEECIIRETEEETGYRIEKVKKVFQTYMSPGSVTEILHLFIGEYNSTMKMNSGGGLASEHEHIEVIEMPYEEAFEKLNRGEIHDAKTLILLQYLRIQHLV